MTELEYMIYIEDDNESAFGILALTITNIFANQKELNVYMRETDGKEASFLLMYDDESRCKEACKSLVSSVNRYYDGLEQ